MAKGFTVVQSDSLESFEEAMDEFLENPTIQEITNCSYQQAMAQTPLGPKIIWIAFIHFNYDVAMAEILVGDGTEQQTLPILEEKSKE